MCYIITCHKSYAGVPEILRRCNILLHRHNVELPNCRIDLHYYNAELWNFQIFEINN